MLRAAVSALGLMSLGACATVTRSPSTDWSVSSEPAGAQVVMSTGVRCDTTPCSLTVERKRRFSATVSMPGYLPETVDVQPKVQLAGGVAFLGNALIGGVLGAGIDIWTGSPLDPMPNGKVVVLRRDPAFERAMAADAASACPQGKYDYAVRVGVPCEALGQPVDLRTLGEGDAWVAEAGYLHSGR